MFCNCILNKNYIFVLTTIVVVIVLVMTFYSPIITSMALQQILLTKDCDGIDKWSKTVASEFDFLLISESQMNVAADFSDECVWKIIESNKSTDTTESSKEFNGILDHASCWNVVVLLRGYVQEYDYRSYLTEEEISSADVFLEKCEQK